MRYTYDANNWLPYTLSYSYQYSPAGKKTRLVWADGTEIDYGYSAHGELESVAIPGEGILSVSQFNWMAPASVILPGGSVQNKTYDGLLNLEGLKVKNPGQQTLLDLANRYGQRQELISRTRSDTAAGVTGTVSGSFSYDDELRLTQSSTDAGNGQDTETFTLNAVGNRTEHSRVLGDWNYDANNRLTDKGLLLDAVSYDYDDSGNLIRKSEIGQVRQYGYDTQNRLIEVKDGSGNLIARYGYDLFDRRIWKEQYRDRSGNTLAQARRSYYLYADEGLIAESRQDITLDANESVSANAEPAIASQYAPRPDAEFTTGLLFVKTKNSNGDDTVAYYHHDHLETPIQATDKNGNVVWSAQYNVFGRATITTPAATLDRPTISSDLRLPGQVEDAETGLHYNWHRYYEPGLGRYVTADPIGLLDGVNRYAYVRGNPANWSDPSGLFEVKGGGPNPSNYSSFEEYYNARKEYVQSPAGQREKLLNDLGKSLQDKINKCNRNKEYLQKIFDNWVVYVDPHIDDPLKRGKNAADTLYSSQTTQFNFWFFNSTDGRTHTFYHEFRHLMEANNSFYKQDPNYVRDRLSGNATTHPGEIDADNWASNFINGDCGC
ncbi:RHS repeat-associated core domain-containing protein [Methylobacter luteus]|uniref:RHS repeat-associated core domain-containing protein n=1 Tax=Methylobacter luteus TaxID=415 RepID=UPI000409EC02|nr:RHS repeat-associated core domain-containing protein [Methylobacter luteus]